MPWRRQRLSAKQKAEILLRLAEFGELIFNEREKRGKTLSEVGEVLGISANYLSEIERGLKSPSDLLIRQIADYYEVNEDILFKKLHRVPLAAREELEDNKKLQKTLIEIRNNRSLSDEKKQEIYDELYRIYRDFLDRIKNEDDDD